MQDFANKTILIAEDNDVSFFLISETLSPINVNLIHACNGKEAVELFGSNQVDFILMDIRMPYMTGVEALKEIRKVDKEIPIYAQTAQVANTEEEEYIALGFNGLLTKPLDLDQIISILEKELT